MSDPSAELDASSRSAERDGRVLRNFLLSLGARGVSLLTMALSMPLALGYLGAARYGFWATLVSLTAFATLAEAGIGNGLVARVAQNQAVDRQAARRYVSAGFLILTLLAAAFALVLLILDGRTSWSRLFNVSGIIGEAEVRGAVWSLAGLLLAGLALAAVARVRTGLQEDYANGIAESAGGFLGLAGLALGVRAGAGLPLLVAAAFGPPLLAVVLNGVALFVLERRWLRPRWRDCTWPAVKSLAGVGGKFFLLQACGVLSTAPDNFLLAHFRGIESVPQYSIPSALFAVPGSLIGLLVWPLWPAYTEAVSRNDWEWVRRTLRRSVALTLVLGAAGALLLVVCSGPLLRLLAGGQVQAPLQLLLGLAGWTLLMSVGNALGTFLNGAGILGFHVLLALTTLGTGILLKILLVRRWGPGGVVWGMVAAYTICTLLPLALFLPRKLKALEAARGSEASG